MGYRDKIFDGVTADAATSSSVAKILRWGTKLIFIKNNHETNGIQYQINVYADYRDTTDSGHTLKAYTALAAGNSIIYKTKDPWDAIYINVKNDSPGNNASAAIWVNGGSRV